jgi:hypothetical protein
MKPIMTKAHWEWIDDYNEDLFCECGGVVNDYIQCSECGEMIGIIEGDEDDSGEEEE